jgi:hypothetical protein
MAGEARHHAGNFTVPSVEYFLANIPETEYPATEHSESRCPPWLLTSSVQSAEFKIRPIRISAASVVLTS